MKEWETTLRKRLLRWHYNKSKTVKILDLLESDYQCFRGNVECRLNMGFRTLGFREAIKKASLEELEMLQNIIDEKRLGI